MCDFVEMAQFEEILRQRRLERKRLYLERCLQKRDNPRLEKPVEKGTVLLPSK